MPTSDSESGKRQYWPPPTWSAKQKKVGPPPPDPPITRRVSLPESVTVAYLAELTGQQPDRIIEELKRLKCYRQRALDFDGAAKLLREYGIGADRENF
jgi:hypothetical protein